MNKIVIEDIPDFCEEDSGNARIATLFPRWNPEELFIRLQSWSEEKRHPVADFLQGKKVRVTIEVIE